MLPHFLGIGAPRAGTTWLHSMLVQHPDVYLPPIKEVHYFDSVDSKIDEVFRVDSLSYRYRKLLPNRLKHYGASALLPFSIAIRAKAKPDWYWDKAFFMPGGGIEWYRGLFQSAAAEGKLAGEITPAYIMLSADTIRKIRNETGVRKIIALLRNPIDATWSCIEKQARDLGTAATTDFGEAEVLDKIKSRRLYARYNYADNLENWLRYYDRSELFLAFYEELQADPAKLLSRVCTFLGIRDISGTMENRSRNAVNAAHGVLGVIPDEAKRVLAELHIDQTRRLAAITKGHAVAWHEEMEAILD